MNTQTENLSSKVVKGSSWLFSFQILDNILAVVRLFILARFLAPPDFGIIGIATLLLQIINTFTQTGIQAVLIHKKDSGAYMNAGWSFLLCRGIILYAAIYSIAPLVGEFFNAQNAVQVIRIIGLSLLFDGFLNIGVVLFQKNLQFGKQFMLQLVGNLSDFIITIVAVVLLHNYWAFVIGAVANTLFRVITSYIISNYRPKFHLDFAKIKEMSGYGKWIAGSNILQFLYSQGDDIFVGKFLGTSTLGYYQLAYRISNLPATQITSIISTVMFPAYSTIQDDLKKLNKIYLLTIRMISYFSFLLSMLIILFAKEYIVLFLGKTWLPIERPLQILTIWGLIRSIGATSGPVWQALGKPKIVTQIQFVQVVLMAIIIYPLTVIWGISGTSVAVVIAALIPNMMVIKWMSHSLGLRVLTILKEFIVPFLGAVIMSLTYYCLKVAVFPDISLVSFLVMSVLVAGSYICFTVALSKVKIYMFYRNILDLLIGFPGFQKHKFVLERIKKVIL